MMRPDAALARPARTALSVVNASSGRSLSLTFCSSHADALFEVVRAAIHNGYLQKPCRTMHRAASKGQHWPLTAHMSSTLGWHACRG